MIESVGMFIITGLLWGFVWLILITTIGAVVKFVESCQNRYYVLKHRRHGNQVIIHNWVCYDTKEEAEACMARNDPILTHNGGPNL
jgi:hypothetical protein